MDKVRRALLADHVQYLERQKMCGILQMATASHHARDSHGNETILSQVQYERHRRLLRFAESNSNVELQ